MVEKDVKKKLFLIILLACLFIFILFAFLFSAFLGSVITSSKCVDSDRGINTYVKGAVSLCVNGDCTVEAEDWCDGDYVTEYYCTNFRQVLSKFSKCTFGCYDGECLHIGEKPAEAEELEEEEEEYKEAEEEEIKGMICDEGWVCDEKIRGFRGADCAWIKEEYCRYGCADDGVDCEMPNWWGRFVFWFREMFS